MANTVMLDSEKVAVELLYQDGSRLKRPLKKCDTPWSRAKGMLGQRNASLMEVYQIVPCHSIHTFFMSFPIDAIFVDSRGYVMKARRISPFRTFSCFGASAVFEGVGLIKENNTLERIVSVEYNQLQNGY